MQKLSMRPIALGLWTQFKSLIKPMLLVAPIMASTDVIDSQSTSSEAEHSYVQKQHTSIALQKELDAVILQISETLIPQIDFALVLLDTIIGEAFYVSELIPENELIEFGQDVTALKHISHNLIKYGNQSGYGLNFAGSVESFSEKVEELYTALYAGKYRHTADQVILPRSYRGEESVGYTFDPSHSFDDFKKALLG